MQRKNIFGPRSKSILGGAPDQFSLNCTAFSRLGGCMKRKNRFGPRSKSISVGCLCSIFTEIYDVFSCRVVLEGRTRIPIKNIKIRGEIFVSISL